MPQPIPSGYHTVTPYLLVQGAARLITFIKKAFGGAEAHPPMMGEAGMVMHAEMQIGDSRIMLADACGEMAPLQAMLHLYVKDCDAVYQQAVAAGGVSVREPANQFYGDRSAAVRDEFGNYWYIATHVEDVPPEEMMRRAAEAMKNAGKPAS